MIRRRILLAATVAGPAAAQGWAPERPIRLVVPFPPGGPTDLVARPLAQRLSEALGQTIVIENRGGAGGNLGAEAVARAAPDGLTLLLSNVGILAANRSLYRTLPFDPARDFAAVAVVAGAPIALVVHPSVPAANVTEFVAWTRAQPAPVGYASAGPGSPGHLAAEVFRGLTGAALTHIPYRGSAPGLQDVIAGHLPAMFDPVQSPLAQVQAGRVRALAVSAPTRSAALPNVPTMAEAGVAGHEMIAWWALVAPAATPNPVLTRLAVEVAKIDTQPAWREGLSRLGITPLSIGREVAPEFLRGEAERWGRAVRESGATAE